MVDLRLFWIACIVGALVVALAIGARRQDRRRGRAQGFDRPL